MIKLKGSLLAGLAIAALLSLGSSAAWAADIVKPNEDTGNVSIGSDETVRNLFTAGGTVTVNGTVERNLHVAGASVMVNGPVGASVYAAGGTVLLRSEVGGSVHVAGGEIVIDGPVADDLIVGGGNVTISEMASVGGDLIIGAGNVVINGPVLGDVVIAAGQATVNSQIGGSVKGMVERLSLGSKAAIGQDLDYKSTAAAIWTEGATVAGTTTFTQAEESRGHQERGWGGMWGFFFVAALVKMLIFLVTGLVLVLVFGRIITPTVRDSLGGFWPNLGIGFAGFFLVPIAGIILSVTVLGLGLAILLGAVSGLAVLIASVLSPIILGSWLIKSIRKSDEYRIGWKEVLVGILAMGVLALIPLVGWLIIFALVLVALGTLYRRLYEMLKR
jgi:hypothetical protein